jgi:hypothetical protein
MGVICLIEVVFEPLCGVPLLDTLDGCPHNWILHGGHGLSVQLVESETERFVHRPRVNLLAILRFHSNYSPLKKIYI